MSRSSYFIKFYQDIQAKKYKKTRQVEGTSYRYIVDKIYVQTDRHGLSSLSQDGYKNEP
jgi:hypothetical protein